MSLSGYDAAYPPSRPPNDAVVMGYIGGDTPHVWTPAEWAGQPARYRIPIWTRSNPGSADPASDARNALAQLRFIGAPTGCLVVLDYETAVDGAYLQSFDAHMQAGGHPVCVYGSASTLFGNPKPSGGYFAAQWTGSPHMYPGAVITQYRDVGAWDDDVIVPGLPLWDTRPPSPSPPIPHPLESDMPYLISVTPDPTNAANPGAGVFTVDGGAVVHVPDMATLATLESRFGAPLAVNTEYYHNLLLSQEVLAGTLSVSGSLSVASKA